MSKLQYTTWWIRTMVILLSINFWLDQGADLVHDPSWWGWAKVVFACFGLSMLCIDVWRVTTIPKLIVYRSIHRDHDEELP